MPHVAYSPERRQEAVQLGTEHGAPEAGRRLGIPTGTVGRWMREAGVPTHAEKTAEATSARRVANASRREELRTELLQKAVALLHRMDEPHLEFRGQQAKEVEYPRAPADAVRNYATSVGILIDKLRLEEGKSTSRDEHVRTSELDRQIDELLSRFPAPAGTDVPASRSA